MCRCGFLHCSRLGVGAKHSKLHADVQQTYDLLSPEPLLLFVDVVVQCCFATQNGGVNCVGFGVG